MDTQLEVKLIECLDALARGESPDRILERYPQDAAQLRPLLETAAGLPNLRMEPSEATKLRSRREFLAQADALRRSTPRRSAGFMPRFAMGFLAAAIVAVLLSTGAVAASGSALPGDPLYGLKRTVENVRLGLSSGAGQKVLTDQFAQRRLDEINQLLSAGRPGEVEFSGKIEALQPAAWIVSGVVVQLDANTQITGTPHIDSTVKVRGITGPQGLRASAILIEAAGETVITPTPAPAETPSLTVTPQATDSPEPTRTHSITPTPSAAVTRPPRATAQPTPTPRPTVPPATPAEVEFSGTVQAINSSEWNIDGTIVIIDANTQFGGSINVGQRVKVKALRFSDEQLVAQQIELLDNGGPDHPNNQNSNQNSNQNGGNNNENTPGGNHNDNHNDNSNNGGGDSHGGNENHNASNSNSPEGNGNGD